MEFLLSFQAKHIYIHCKSTYEAKGKCIQGGHNGDFCNMNNCQNVRKIQRSLNYCRKIWNLGENVKYMI